MSQTLTVSLEWHADWIGTIRVHPSGGSYKEHSPYSAVATILLKDGTWSVIAWCGDYTVPIRRAVRKLVNDNGIFEVEIQRFNVVARTLKLI